MKNYIFGTGPFAIDVAKILERFNIKIDGFLKIGDKEKNNNLKLYNEIPLLYVDEKSSFDFFNSNIIITKKPIIMGDTIDFLRKNKVSNLYIVDEKILFDDIINIEQLNRYIDKIDLQKPFLNYLEMNVVDHCNLNCKGCAHFSNICDNNIVKLEEFKRDMELIANNFNVYNFRVLGGEPFLHPELKELLCILKEKLKGTRITIVTNGLLLDRADKELLDYISKNDILLTLSLYEPTYEKIDKIKAILNEYNIKYLFNDDFYRPLEKIDKFQTRLTLEKENDGLISSKKCTGRFCRFVRNGKITKCYYPLLVDILNKKYGTSFIVDENDYIELDKITNGWDVIDRLNKKIPFCDYCSINDFEFDWKGYHKNDKDISGYVLKKAK